MSHRIAFLPAEQKTESIFPNRDINWYMTVADLSQISGKHGLNLKAEREITRRYVDDLCIKITRQTQPIFSLRGGNQQKVILGRWFHRNPQVLVLEEPTHGIDVNAKNEVYNLIIEYVGRDVHESIPNTLHEELCTVLERVVEFRSDPLSTLFNTVGTAYEICRGGDWFESRMSDFAYPVFMIHGEDDCVVSVKDTYDFSAQSAHWTNR